MKNNWKPIEDRVKYEIELDLDPGIIVISSNRIFEEHGEHNVYYFAELELNSKIYDLNNFADFDNLETIKEYISKNMENILRIRDKIVEVEDMLCDL
jgi:hypothetical protein